MFTVRVYICENSSHNQLYYPSARGPSLDPWQHPKADKPNMSNERGHDKSSEAGPSHVCW